MQSRTCWYRCPSGHVFETEGKTQHHYCQLCQKIYSLKGASADAVRLVKIGNRLVPKNSPTLQEQRSRYRTSHNRANARWRSKNPDYNKKRYQDRKQELDEEHRRWMQKNQKRYRSWKRQYNKSYNAKPDVKWIKADKMKILRGLAMLGLGESPDKKYRENKKLKSLLAKLNISALVCPQCNGRMDFRESGSRYCTNKNCGYFIPPTEEILSIIKNK